MRFVPHVNLDSPLGIKEMMAGVFWEFITCLHDGPQLGVLNKRKKIKIKALKGESPTASVSVKKEGLVDNNDIEEGDSDEEEEGSDDYTSNELMKIDEEEIITLVRKKKDLLRMREKANPSVFIVDIRKVWTIEEKEGKR